MNKKELNKNIFLYLSGQLSDGEKASFENLPLAPEEREYFQKIKKMWDSISPPMPQNIPDFEEFWAGIEPELIADAEKINPEVKNSKAELFPRFSRKRAFAYGAVLSFAVIACIACVYLFTPGSPRIIHYSAGNAQRLEVTLPDGSKARLNSGTEISFPEKFGGQRNIELNGEAFFSVEKTGAPFVVNTPNASVTVTGTKFNVRARGGKTNVAVAEGAVILKSAALKTGGLTIKAGESGACLYNELPLKTAAPGGSAIPWLNNTIAFYNTPLSEISEELTRQYNMKIIIADSSLAACPVTGEFSGQKIDEILQTICLTLDLKYKTDNSAYIIYKK
jgi:ferric-dicitrate binding protein FerR (iron transport regulator)